ncbi:MAG: hypothetical protein ABJH52_13580 [Henriciella sp.]
MLDLQTLKKATALIVTICLIVQIGFAIGVFGPAWLSPILTLPALSAIAFLWRRVEKLHSISSAFNELVI